MTVSFEHSTVIDAPAELVFDLSRDIDVHLASMTSSGERAVAGVTSGRIGLGESVTWRARHFGIPFTMTSRVREYDRPRRFVDEQVEGPFAWFRHEHRFDETGDATVMTDRLDFDAPLGPLGDVVERLLLGRYLHRLIEQRGQYLKAEAERRAEGSPKPLDLPG